VLPRSSCPWTFFTPSVVPRLAAVVPPPVRPTNAAVAVTLPERLPSCFVAGETAVAVATVVVAAKRPIAVAWPPPMQRRPLPLVVAAVVVERLVVVVVAVTAVGPVRARGLGVSRAEDRRWEPWQWFGDLVVAVGLEVAGGDYLLVGLVVVVVAAEHAVDVEQQHRLEMAEEPQLPHGDVVVVAAAAAVVRLEPIAVAAAVVAPAAVVVVVAAVPPTLLEPEHRPSPVLGTLTPTWPRPPPVPPPRLPSPPVITTCVAIGSGPNFAVARRRLGLGGRHFRVPIPTFPRSTARPCVGVPAAGPCFVADF